MPESKLPETTYGDLHDEIDKLGKEDKLRLLQDLSSQLEFSDKDWQSLAPFLIPEKLRRKLLMYPWSQEDRRNFGLIIKVPILVQDPAFRAQTTLNAVLMKSRLVGSRG